MRLFITWKQPYDTSFNVCQSFIRLSEISIHVVFLYNLFDCYLFKDFQNTEDH